ncbi:hypothetical protein K1X22_23985 [Mycolicibacterium farcinogenes]|uniref:hypothetical protein n=1 Tax=Mycolicibacterium farcinogenes TaxID=1802 RepID=UPI001C8D2D30|nr:hypothetical protein [Mycolicibacterium farcinogenes]QZH59240.1 hypothetical protein K1X22_23985 [Mycolicibacterium farcinogenes]
MNIVNLVGIRGPSAEVVIRVAQLSVLIYHRDIAGVEGVTSRLRQQHIFAQNTELPQQLRRSIAMQSQNFWQVQRFCLPS